MNNNAIVLCSRPWKNVKKRHSHVVVMQRQLRNVQKSIIHVQSCCFANLNPLLSCRTLCCRCHHCLSTLLAPISKARDCRYSKTPFNTDTEGAIESVLLNRVSVKWGLTPGVGWGGLLGLMFAGFMPLASQSPNPFIVYFLANYRPHLKSLFWKCNFRDPNLVTFYLCIYLINVVSSGRM